MSLLHFIFIFSFFSLIAQKNTLASSPAPIQPDLHLTKYSIDSKIEGIESLYTPILIQMAKNWSDKTNRPKEVAGRSVFAQVFETVGQASYIGIEQMMTIEAPLSDVELVLDDVNHYSVLFPGYEDIHIVAADGNKFDVFWESIIPIFFIPNVKYMTTYIVDKTNTNRKLYRMQLKEKKGLEKSDTLIVIERAGLKTSFAEYDFWDANYGLLNQLGPRRIWKDSLEGVILSDLALKIKSEKPEMSYSDIRTLIKAQAETYPLDSLIDKKEVFRPFAESPK